MHHKQLLKWPDSCAKAGILFITMVKDEREMLRQWLGHYKACIDDPAFLIVDDGSTLPVSEWIHLEFPDLNISVFSLPPSSFSDRYKSNVLSALAAIGVGRYRIVISSDVDEIIFSSKPIALNTLGQFLLSLESGIKAPIGIHVVQHTEQENVFIFEKPLLEQRKYGIFHSAFIKPILWADATGVYSVGQHLLDKQDFEVVPEFIMAHLKYVDYTEYNIRQKVRNRLTYGQDQNPNHGKHWREQVGSDKNKVMFDKLLKATNIEFFEKGLGEFISESCDCIDGRLLKNEKNTMLGPVHFKLFR